MLPIKGSVYVHSGHLVLVLDTEHFAWHLVGRKRVLSQDLAGTSNSKNAFLYLLSLFGSSEPVRHHYLLG